LLALLAPLSVASAQSTLDHPVGGSLPYFMETGEWDGAGDQPEVVFEHAIHVPNAAWIRVYFADAKLDAGSTVRMTSKFDNESQELDAAGLDMWSYGSAYFNGDTVLLELIAAPGSVGNSLTIHDVGAELLPAGETRGGAGQCGICGADDRAASNEDWSCRLMSVGCTASVFTTNSCLVSAGHCISGQLVAQFRVPATTAGCATVNPPVADQFPVTSTSQQNAGVGADWSVLRVGTNGAANGNQRPFQRYGKLKRIAPALAATTNPVEMFGFGVDLTCTRSQTQQRSGGAITAVMSAHYEFNADVRGGNSGSGLLKDGRIIAIVTHCSVGCPNFGTRVDRANFATARSTLCPACVTDITGDGATNIDDLAVLLARFGFCFPSGSFGPEADLNADNCVDMDDLTLLLSAFGTNCP
jgi:hypothetical protein